jgi:cellulose synthase/poly-beta-1,6-N-acetylglucosamine synthase-like glycosyltransferase
MSSIEPRVTVFTPFYKNIAFFDETIASVLSQSYTDFEYLMINDGDPADARRIEETFRDPRIRIINTASPLGLSGSRNAGLHEARGELIAFIDSDDFCEPGRLRKQVDFLDAHPDHVLVGSGLRYVNEKSETIGSRSYPETDAAIKARLVAVNCIAQPSVTARRQALMDAGGYTGEFPCAEDYALWIRLARFGKFHNLQEPLVGYRIHLESGKHVLLRPALRDTIGVKIAALRRYGFRATPRAMASIAAHTLLLGLPSPVIYWLFRRLIVKA